MYATWTLLIKWIYSRIYLYAMCAGVDYINIWFWLTLAYLLCLLLSSPASYHLTSFFNPSPTVHYPSPQPAFCCIVNLQEFRSIISPQLTLDSLWIYILHWKLHQITISTPLLGGSWLWWDYYNDDNTNNLILSVVLILIPDLR